MHTTVFSGAIVGVDGLVVEAEVDISRGIPAFSIVGLPNTAVRESRERVTAAIKNSGWEFPLERITVNLAPADIKKEGSAFDLAIAVGMLAASRQIDAETGAIDKLPGTIFLGELALDGSLRKVPGVLPIVLHARERGFHRAVIPQQNIGEASAASGIEVWGCRRLLDVVAHLSGAEPDGVKGVAVKRADDVVRPPSNARRESSDADMSDVRGQESAKRALLVAAAGGHHVLMVGPPGAGKTMLARRFATILPPLSDREALETTMIHSIVGLLDGGGLVAWCPFRAPHHSASDAGLIGGGPVPRPGEITLAHNGVLFLDELPEFKRHVLETLREPLEEGRITISRARCAVTFPARFQLIAAMNPCPCGHLGSNDRQCRCSPMQVEKYLSKISGPLLDRISIHVTVRPVDIESLSGRASDESSDALRGRALAARAIQRARFAGDGTLCNAGIPEGVFASVCPMTDEASELLVRAHKSLRISARGRAHVIRVARTVADLDECDVISEAHIAEAIQYRIRDF